MASTALTGTQQNFVRLAIAVVDKIKLPMKDLLEIYIKPCDLYNKIRLCPALLLGKHKLSEEQKDLCYVSPPYIPDYAKFDVSLLYKLIQNLCKKVVTTKGWGKEPESGDNLIGDDIERLRRIRNEIYGHLKSSSIPDVMFESQWKELEDIMKRMCTFLNSNGSNPVNYERELADVKRCDCGSNHMDQYKLMLRLLEPNKEKVPDLMNYHGLELPTISVRGETTIMCGKTVRFEVDIKHSSTSTQNWPITWHRLKGNISEQIDTSAEKYRNSTCCQLMINGASKEDQGDYQAIISGTPNERHIKIHSNVLSLKVFGEEPDLQELEVTSDEWDEIILRYRYEVSQGSPKANLIQWTRNDQVLKVDQEKYVGGDLTDNFLTITSPSIHDSGEYTCTVFNAAGSASRSFTLGVPKVKIQAESVCYGNNALITSVVSSCPPAAKAVWEKSSLSDENKFETITDSDPKYFYNSSDPRGPILNVTAATFDDKLYYRLRITNCIGESVSDRALLNVTGDRPNIFSNHETKANSCSVILTCDVFLYGKSPPITKIAWQKDGKVINATTGKYTGGTELNPALVIHNVNKFDAGSYQCKVTNEVGSTLGNVICLDVPKIEIKEQRNEANDRLEFTAVLNSIPEPIHAQWSIKSENNHGFTPIDVNREEYKGTSNNIPKPVLCIKHVPLQNRIFQIEVQNFIGTTKMQIPGERKPCSQEKMSYPKVVNGLTEIFRKNGTSIRFSDLLIDLIKEISDEELVSLKRIATVTSSMKLSEGYGKTVDDFFTYLLKKDIFNERNVIMIQYLMRRIQRLQLELKCIEYAKNEKENLCYFEETKPAEDGKTHVKLHVNDNIEQFTNMDSLLATVAAIANCERSSIEIVGLRPASSFIIVISMKEDSAKRLRQKSPHELVALMMYKVDWIEIENEPIYIPRSKGQTYGKRKHAERDFLTDENKRCRRASLGNTMELPFKSDPCKSNTGAELEEMDFSDDEDVLVDTSNVNIPKEVLKWDYDARGRNVACAKKGTQTMHRARAMIVGCAGAGKTTFLRRLQQRNIQELRQIQSTVGLEVFENLFEVDREHKSLRGLEKDVDTENKCLLSVVDFAGQCAYYACHQVYLSRRAFYLLVINMSKSFDEKVDQELCEQEGTMFADWTFGQYVLFWLKSIHTYCEDNTPVVTVATHSDEVQDMVNKSIYDDLLELLKYEPDLRKHLDRERCFHIGLPEDDNEPLDKLTDTVECIASIALEDRWRDTIPKEWSLCEVVLRQNKQNGKKIISVTDFRKQVSIKKFGKGNETFDVLRFYHDIGAILYYNENHLKDRAITDVQWFVDCFKNIITDPKHVRDLVENDKDWKNFFESGYLTQGLLKGIWKKKKMDVRKCNSTLKYMQRLGLLAVGKDAHYVPCMNKLDFGEHLKYYITHLEQQTSVLVFSFRFLPHFFYFRLIVACIVSTEWTIIEENGQKCLFKNIALFKFEGHIIGVAVTTSFIQVQIFKQGNGHLSGEITRKIKKTMEDVLEQLAKNFHKKTLYEIGYQCSKQNVTEGDALCFISEKELIGRGEFSCPNHGLEKHHIIKEKELLLFWKYDSDNIANQDDCTTNAPVGKLPNQNYYIFTQLIDIGRKSLQIYFDKIFPSKDIISIFMKNKVDMEHGKNKFNKDQLAILFAASGTSPSSSAFDVTIMYKLLRYYGPNVQDPLVGWGNKPEVGKKSETDDVERIRYYRNMVVHQTDKTMEQEELDIFWKDLSQAIMRLSNGTLEKEIQALKMQK